MSHFANRTLTGTLNISQVVQDITGDFQITASGTLTINLTHGATGHSGTWTFTGSGSSSNPDFGSRSTTINEAGFVGFLGPNSISLSSLLLEAIGTINAAGTLIDLNATVFVSSAFGLMGGTGGTSLGVAGAPQLPPVISIDQYSGRVFEDAGVVEVTLSRSFANINQTSSVILITEEGAATSTGEFRDFDGVSIPVTFAAGETSVKVAIPNGGRIILNDDTPEQNETFNIRLTSPVNATLGVATGSITILDNDTVGRARIGTAGADTMEGSTGADTLSGAGGNDTLNGRAGNDTLNGDGGEDTAVLSGVQAEYTFSRLSETAVRATNNTTGEIDVLNRIEHVRFGDGATNPLTFAGLLANTSSRLADFFPGGVGPNVFYALAGNDTVFGGDGADHLIGDEGNDVLDGEAGADTLNGGLGNDTFVVDGEDQVIELAGQGTDVVKTALASYTLGANLEQLQFTGDGAFSGTGNALPNKLAGDEGGDTLVGLGGNDLLIGGAGADTLDGGLGADRMEGGAGNDTYVVEKSHTLIANPDGTMTTIPGDVVFEGTALADSGGIDTVRGAVSYVLGPNVEKLVLLDSANLNINGNGNALENSLTGNSGNNVLNGAAGDDTFFASGGNDRFVGGAGNDTLNLAAVLSFAEKEQPGGFSVTRPNTTTLVITDLATSLKYTVTGPWGAITGTERGIESFAFSDQTVTLAQLIVNTASAFADTLTPGAGVTSVAGLAGNDTYVIDSAVEVIELLGQGTDLVKTTLVAYALGANVEQLQFTGEGAFSGTGNAQPNKLIGGAGADTLDGGAGADRMEGGGGNDTYIVDRRASSVANPDGTFTPVPGDTVVEALGGGTDTVRSSVSYALATNVEDLVLQSAGNINGTGNAGDNSLIGNSERNTLAGAAGNDTLNGGAGNDRLVGGAGADAFVFDTALSETTNVDRLIDFQSGVDRIRLDADVFTGLAVGELSAGALRAAAGATQAADADDRIVYNSTTGALYFDADGLGGAAAVQFATLNAGLILAAADFAVI